MRAISTFGVLLFSIFWIFLMFLDNFSFLGFAEKGRPNFLPLARKLSNEDFVRKYPNMANYSHFLLLCFVLLACDLKERLNQTFFA